MPDQLKEIFNADTYLNSFSSASKTIVTTNSTTQYMIKDVQVGTNTIPGTEALTVNGMTVAPSLATNVAGAEIVDVSSTVALQLPATPVFTKSSNNSMSNGYSSGSVYTSGTAYSVSVGASSSTTSVGTAYPAISTAFNTTNGSAIEHWVIGSDVYYWSFNMNNTWAFYKRTGGFNGTETLLKDSSSTGTITQNPGQYAYVLYSASANKFYLFGNNNIVVTYDPLTNTSTSVAISAVGWPSTSTYVRATLSNNGLIFVLPSSSYGANVWAINPVNGAMINFQSLEEITNHTSWSQSSRLFVYFSGTQYYIWRVTGSYAFLARTNSGAVPTYPSSSSSYYSNYVVNNAQSSLSLGNVTSLPLLTDTYTTNNERFLYVTSTSATAPVIRSIDLTNIYSYSDSTLSANILSGVGFKGFTAPTTPTAGELASTTNFPQLIRLRVTGVETTL